MSRGHAAEPPFTYRMLGLLVRSEIELPEVPRADPADAPAEILIIRGTVAPERGLVESDEDYPPYEVRGRRFFIEREGVARFLAEDGRSVTVDAHPEAADVDVRVFLLGSVLGALCHQRDLVPLHAAAVGDKAGCFAFAGPSGTGKSTISAGLRQIGLTFVADDICPVVLDSGRHPAVLAGLRRVKLGADTLEALGQGSGAVTRDHRSLPKFHLPVEGGDPSVPVPLTAVYMFRHDPEALRGPRIEAISPAYAVRCYENLTYMPRYPRAAGVAEAHFLRCASLAALVPLFLVHHRRGMDRLPRLLDRLASHLRPTLGGTASPQEAAESVAAFLRRSRP